ncbi:signal peptidase II [candidate division WWE3 bacterium]|nr:signal peptidase II [candidate division WWE3 bacterium]
MNCSHIFSGIISTPTYLLGYVLVLVFVILWFWFIYRDRVGKWLILFIVFGASYNLYFRLLGYCVPDPFSFFGLFRFNLADILIDIGVLTLAIYTLITDPMPKNK